ncbi:3-methyl-2-oxobutanoate hydroxymethyltransferase [Kitasatospora sp. NPDC008050]|uniref:3-methyl-2-oxobutanoate hydroxymethyltransferase n=1 Tax=Kitasatospora sp. NPDC008050 TaxID=3364021 RepID=UPI0036F0FFB7
MSTDLLTPAIGSTQLACHLRRFDDPGELGLKINLYRGLEVEGLARALAAPGLADSPIECLMVGDSYFMTHLGRPGTVLAGAAEQEWALATLVALVAEVRGAMERHLPTARRPFLLADLPDGATADRAAALAATARYTAAGADAVKIEVAGERELRCVEAVAATGVPTVAHLGYTPQLGRLARHGEGMAEALTLFAQARRAREAGAAALVVEMVSEPVNQALSRPHQDGLPVYSVFSGRARWGGQSLNLWDSVVRPARPSRFFPPTAVLDAAEVPTRYTPELIGDRMAELIRLTRDGGFPLSPRTALTEHEIADLSAFDPWSAA